MVVSRHIVHVHDTVTLRAFYVALYVKMHVKTCIVCILHIVGYLQHASRAAMRQTLNSILIIRGSELCNKDRKQKTYSIYSGVPKVQFSYKAASYYVLVLVLIL